MGYTAGPHFCHHFVTSDTHTAFFQFPVRLSFFVAGVQMETALVKQRFPSFNKRCSDSCFQELPLYFSSATTFILRAHVKLMKIFWAEKYNGRKKKRKTMFPGYTESGRVRRLLFYLKYNVGSVQNAGNTQTQQKASFILAWHQASHKITNLPLAMFAFI